MNFNSGEGGVRAAKKKRRGEDYDNNKEKRLSERSDVCALLLVMVVGGLLIFATACLFCRAEEEVEGEMSRGGMLGAPKDVENFENSVEIDEMAQFAVQEHNFKEGKNLTFKKVVAAKRQVVAGLMYYLTLEATQESSDQPKLFDAKVWHKPRENHKSLEHFKETESSKSG